MTPLARLLAARIAATGPISLADYMADCLLHPVHGYYTTRDPLGAAGDFTTAPEISQMFGEMLAACLAQVWADQGRPEAFTLAELGPGRGTLMADILRVADRMPGMRAALGLHLVEASPALRSRQRQALAGHGVTWHDGIDTLPADRPLYVVANEFLDALPIRQFQRAGAGWCERMVGLDDAGALTLRLAPPAPLAGLAHRLADTAEGDIVELCPALPAIVSVLADTVARQGGVAIFLDYGDWRSKGDTFQALRAHAPEDPLASPGAADLTAHVDFEAVAGAMRGTRVTAMTPQGVFLERLGITARAQALAARLTGPALDSHVAAHRRLTHPQEMGSLFKVIACTPPDMPLPPGLEPEPQE